MEEKYQQLCMMLRQLGVSSYDGRFSQTAYAGALCAELPDRLRSLIMRVYSETAAQYGTSWMAVEMNINAVSEMVQKENRAGFEALTGYSLCRGSGAALFLAALVSALNREPTPGRKGVTANGNPVGA